MSFFSRLFSRVAGFSKKAAAGIRLVGSAYGAGGLFGSQNVSADQLMREARGWVFACVSKIAESIGAVELKLYKKNGKGPEDWEEVADHPMIDLLNRPNSWMPRFDLFAMWSMHDDLVGNSYWLLEGVKDEKSIPTAIYPLNPKDVKVKVGTAQEGVLLYHYTQGGKDIILQPYEVLHFRRSNPNNPYIGMGPTEAGIDSIDSDNWMKEWNRKFFQNAAIPSSIFETQETSPEAIRLLRESYEDRHAGVEKSHKSLFLPKDVKFADKGYGQKDMDFVESRRLNRDEILAYFGVPPIVLGMGLGESINRATAETQEYVFAKYTIRPKLRRFVTFLNEFFVPRFGDDIVLEFDDPVPENAELAIQQAVAGLGGAPYLSMNEVRQREGLPPIPEGNVIMGSNIQVPFGTVPKRKGLKGLALPTTTKQRKRLETLKDNVVEAVKAALLKTTRELKRKSIADLKEADWSTYWKAFVDRTTPEEKRMREAMAEYAKAMTKRAETNVRRELKTTRKTINISTILDRKDEVAAIVKLMDPIYLDILKKEGVAAAELVDSAFDETEKRMRKALEKAIDLMARKYTDETLGTLKKRLEDGLAYGEGIDELTKGVQEIGEWSSTVRAERVAKTEAFRTANFATKEAWKQSGVVTEIKWYTADDERVCVFCDVMDGKVVGIEQNFIDKGDTLTTEDSEGNEVKLLIDYANVEAGSLHPNCRCYVRPETITIG